MDNEKMLLPEGWVRVNLPDFTDIVMGQSPPSETYNNKKEGLPFFQGKAEFDKKFPIAVKYCSKPVKIARKGATLLSVRAPVGPTNMAFEKCCIGRGLCAIHPLGKIPNNFVFWLFRCIESQLSSKGTGSTFSAISKQYIERLSFNLPPLNEQHRIVTKIEELFSEIDKGVESLQKANELLILYRQSLLKHAFEGKLTEQWRKENPDKVIPADELLEQIKQARESRYQQQLEEWESAVKLWESEGKKGKKPSKPFRLNSASLIKTEELNGLLNLPQDWLYVRLSEVAEIGSGQALSKSKKLGDPIEVSYLRVANVQRGKLVLDEIKTMQIERCQLKKLELKQWDILFNEGGDRDKLGRGWIWESQIIPCITQNHVFRATPYLESEAFSKLISHWGNSFGQQYFDAEGKQTTNLASINKTVLSNFPVPLLSKTEQIEIISQIDSCLSVIDKLDNDIELALTQSATLKQSILKKAFSGQLVPQDPNDEPASVLLERIKAEKARAGCN
ncbi:MAG: restriction endonuclease subunit S [Desulfamplus sp.]|nr:restriction endonuclease subunit S [Desulfamplus sp.]